MEQIRVFKFLKLHWISGVWDFQWICLCVPKVQIWFEVRNSKVHIVVRLWFDRVFGIFRFVSCLLSKYVGGTTFIQWFSNVTFAFYSHALINAISQNMIFEILTCNTVFDNCLKQYSRFLFFANFSKKIVRCPINMALLIVPTCVLTQGLAVFRSNT